jgi:hypothetical protein
MFFISYRKRAASCSASMSSCTDGSYSVRTLPPHARVRFDVAYNAKTDVQTSYQQGGVKGLRLYVRATHLDPGAPGYSPEGELAAGVRQAVAVRDPQVRNVSFNGRSAWTLTLTFGPGEALYVTYGARVDAVVDRATGLVLQVTRYAYSPSRWTSIETIDHLRPGARTTAADFRIPEPAGAWSRHGAASDRIYRRCLRA